jgi:cell wall-associated NlpC family hydrolase
MTPPSRLSLIRFAQISCRSALFLAFIAGTATAPLLANAMPTPDARASLQGLSASPKAVEYLRDRIVQAGLDAVGTPYSWGGRDPEDGFDCSGLVGYVFHEVANMNMPRRARDQIATGKKVAKSQLQPGDLVFFNAGRRRGVSHVGIYIGEDKFVHAPTRGSSVRVDSMESAYWVHHFSGARAYLKADSVKTALLTHSDK